MTYLAQTVNDRWILMMLNSFLKSSNVGFSTCGNKDCKNRNSCNFYWRNMIKKNSNLKQQRYIEKYWLTSTIFVSVYVVCSKSIETEVAFTKTEMNNEWNVVVPFLFNKQVPVSFPLVNAPSKTSLLICWISLDY